MSAIFGEISYKSPLFLSEDNKHTILDTMSKRGPDSQGFYKGEYIRLLHSRLCIIDKEKGAQPMTLTISGREIVIVYDGRLYNREELYIELIEKGYEFEGKSDAELVLRAYAEWSEQCISKLDGAFAFAIWDNRNNRLFLARDRMGVKPLFYTFIDEKFLFSSEIKSLLAYPCMKAKIDIESISELILIGPGRTPGYGIFKGISEIPPAHSGYYSREGFKLSSYWEIVDSEHTDSFSKTAKTVSFLVKDSIKRQLLSDYPICAFLSGGLDSSIISAVAAQHMKQRGEKLHTFSLFYKDNDKHFKSGKFQPERDDEYIDIMTNHLQCENHKITIDTIKLADALFQAVDARDLPGMADVDSSLILLCDEIKKDFKTALSGECADEIFGGYPWYRDKSIRESEGFPWAQSTAWRYSFLKPWISESINADKYVFDKYRATVNSADISYTKDFSEQKSKQMIQLNHKWFMQTLLERTDRISMYSGLEVRVPFCDYKISQYLYCVPWEYKDYKDYEKGLLRESVKDLLPEKVLWRKKSPYPKTHNPSYLKEVSSRLQDIISSPNEPIHQIIKKDMLNELINSERQIPWYGQLMTIPQTIAYFLQLNYWLCAYKIQLI